MHPLAIIGLDPGTTSAYAILGLDGKIIHSYAAKELPLSEIISQTIKVCQPVIVATDKAKVPSLVEDFARKMGTVIVSPEEDLKKEMKRELLLPHGYGYNGSHEHDCFAAAYLAYRQHYSKLQKIEQFIAKHNLHDQRHQFSKIALKEDFNFALIRDVLTRPEIEHTIINEVVQENKITKRNFFSLYERWSKLNLETALLKKKIQHQQERSRALQKVNLRLQQQSFHVEKRIAALFKFKEERIKHFAASLQRGNQDLQRLQQQVQSLYSFISQTTTCQLLKKLPSLTLPVFRDRHQLLQIKPGDVLLVADTAHYSQRVLDELDSLGVIILSGQNISSPVKERFQTAVLSGSFQAENAYFALVQKGAVKKLLEQQDLLGKVVNEYQEARRKS